MFNQKFFSSKFFSPKFFARISSGNDPPSTYDSVIAAVVGRLLQVQGLGDSVWADRFPPNQDLPRCLVWSISSPVDRSGYCVGSLVKNEVVQVSLYDSDPDRIGILGHRVESSLLSARLNLSTTNRRQRFISVDHVNGPIRGTEMDRETNSRILFFSHTDFSFKIEYGR